MISNLNKKIIFSGKNVRYSRWLTIILLWISLSVYAHHYKGLPHYGYFENYPQVPLLEFLGTFDHYEVLVTVYNFQGLNIEEVSAPNDVRFFMYIYNLEQDKPYSGKASFRLLQNQKVLFDIKDLPAEQESIYIINRTLPEEGKLKFSIEFQESSGKHISGMMDIYLREDFLSKYGIYLSLAGFFTLVIGLRSILPKKYHSHKKKLD